MMNAQIGYATTNFKHAILTKILELPTFETLKNHDLKANTASFPYDLR